MNSLDGGGGLSASYTGAAGLAGVGRGRGGGGWARAGTGFVGRPFARTGPPGMTGFGAAATAAAAAGLVGIVVQGAPGAAV